MYNNSLDLGQSSKISPHLDGIKVFMRPAKALSLAIYLESN